MGGCFRELQCCNPLSQGLKHPNSVPAFTKLQGQYTIHAAASRTLGHSVFRTTRGLVPTLRQINMAPSEERERRDEPLSSLPDPVADNSPSWTKPSIEDDRVSIPSSSRSGSASEAEGTMRNGEKHQRPKLHTRKSSGTIIVPAASSNIEVDDEEYDEGDARTMSPRRSSEEVDRLEEGLRQNMIE